MNRTFTGRHMAIIMVVFFGVVIAVNVVNAIYASSTFGGMVVENSYVASQKFNGWLKEARQEKALGWTVAVERGRAGRLEVQVTDAGRALAVAKVEAVVRHPLGGVPERSLSFRDLGSGRYESLQPLPAGRWIVHLTLSAEGRQIRRIVDLS
jgi:nitrogen fixation protein FixH